MLVFLMPAEVRRSFNPPPLVVRWVRTFFVLRYPSGVETVTSPRTHRPASTHSVRLHWSLPPSGAVARLGGVRVVRDSSGLRPRVCALRVNRPGVRGDAGLARRWWLDQELVRLDGVTHHRPAARFPCIQTGVYRTCASTRRITTGACRRGGLRYRC